MASDASHKLAAFSDEQLIDRYRQGNAHAFATLVDRYQQELFHFLVRFCANRASADDVFQETFLQVHRSIDTFDTDRRFRPWLFTIAANKARDFLRKNKKQRTVSLSTPAIPGDDSGRGYLDIVESDLPLPDDLAHQNELGELVREVVESLPDHLREVLVLAYFHKFPYREIADMLEIPIGTVKSRLHSAVGTFGQVWRSRYNEQ